MPRLRFHQTDFRLSTFGHVDDPFVIPADGELVVDEQDFEHLTREVPYMFVVVEPTEADRVAESLQAVIAEHTQPEPPAAPDADPTDESVTPIDEE